MPCPKCKCKVTYRSDSIGTKETCANCNYTFYIFEDDGENIEEQELEQEQTEYYHMKKHDAKK